MADRPESPLRVHLVHQSFGDYVSAMVEGFTRGVKDGGKSDVGSVVLSVTTVTNTAATLSGVEADPAGRQATGRRQRTVPRFRDPRSPLRSWRTVRDILATPCDVVHWQAAGNPWVDLAFSLLMKRTPTVVTIHDMVPHPGDSNVLPGTFFAIKRLARRADRVTVHAPHVKQQVIDAGVDGAKVRVIAHGELATRYLPVTRLPLAPTDEPTVLFFGRAQGYKGLDLLVEAMSRLNGKGLNGQGLKARLVVAGSGPSIDALFPGGKGVPPWCTLRSGHIPVDEVATLFGEAAVVALPYREASQSGVAALAAGFGRPVVATAVPGLTDIVESGQTGLLVAKDDPDAFADGLRLVLEDHTLRQRLGQGAYHAAESRLSWPAITSELHSVYLEARSVYVGPRSVYFGPMRARGGGDR